MSGAILPQGARIAMVAPSGIHKPEQLATGKQIATSLGYTLVPVHIETARHRYLAATDDLRRNHLIHALSTPEFDGVWMTRGGFGLTRIIASLPNGLPRKPIIGFSDGTALFARLYETHTCVHGPVIHSLPNTTDQARDHLRNLLQGGSISPLAGNSWHPGSVTAPIVGGNLAMLAALCGTPHQLDARGKILLIEEVGEAPYRIDRMLTQLQAAGCFEGVAGVAFGSFTDCRVPSTHDYTITEILVETTEKLAVPVIGNIPIGHGPQNFAFIWGQTATITKDMLSL